MAKKKPYISEEESERLTKELAEYADAYKLAKANGTELPRLNNFIGSCILKIATNMASSHKYSGYTWRDELIGHAYLVCCSYSYSFDKNYINKQGKPISGFSYLSFNIGQAFSYIITKEKTQQYLKWKSLELSGIENFEEDGLEYNPMEGESESETPRGLMMADINSKIAEFEIKMDEKKRLQREKYEERNKVKEVPKSSVMKLFS